MNIVEQVSHTNKITIAFKYSLSDDRIAGAAATVKTVTAVKTK